MTQTLALLLDAYRELNAKKLFWITLILSGLVAACFFLVGINDDGIKLVVWQLDNDILNAQVFPPDLFYKVIFSSLAVKWWMGIVAAVLAIISTASFFPDLVQQGSIDLMLSKPIGRLRLFATRYLTGLLFAFLQIFIFTLICFLVIGIRGGVWEPGLFIAVPFFILFFSYIFCVSVYIGVTTRSTIAAILVTLLLWALLMGLNTTDSVMMSIRLMNQSRVEMLDEQIEVGRGLEGEELEKFEQWYGELYLLEQEAQAASSSAKGITTASNVVYGVKWMLPKTGETLDLLQRNLLDAADLPSPEDSGMAQPEEFAPGMRSDHEIMQENAKELERPTWWIVGTSLLFEFIIVGLAAFKFCRRDY